MDKDDIKKLKQLSEYLEISKRDFKKVLALAICYQKESNEHISWELLCHLVEETMINMDYEVTNENTIANNKTIKESFIRALSNLGYNEIKRIK